MFNQSFLFLRISRNSTFQDNPKTLKNDSEFHSLFAETQNYKFRITSFDYANAETALHRLNAVLNLTELS